MQVVAINEMMSVGAIPILPNLKKLNQTKNQPPPQKNAGGLPGRGGRRCCIHNNYNININNSSNILLYYIFNVIIDNKSRWYFWTWKSSRASPRSPNTSIPHWAR
jgi:hypothetical protein